MEAYQLVLGSWRAKLAESERYPDGFAFASAPEFQAFRKLRSQGEHDLLAAAYEAVGTADLLLIRTQPGMPPSTLLGSLGFLVLAAHWYRVAGDLKRSTLVGTRALLELTHVLQAMDAGNLELPAPHVRWYAVEMAGDAAVCCDLSEAARLYREAEAGFRNVGRTDQMSDAQDPVPGEYLSAMMPLLCPDPPANLEDNGVARVSLKLWHWVGE